LSRVTILSVFQEDGKDNKEDAAILQNVTKLLVFCCDINLLKSADTKEVYVHTEA
jgi:hypothetical protein